MRSQCASKALLLIVFLFACVEARASEFELLLLEVAVNGQPAQNAFALRDQAETFHIEKDVVDTWSIDTSADEIVTHHGMHFVPLVAIEGTTWEFDRSALRLAVQVPPRYMESQLRVLREDTSPPPVAGWGSFVDYDFSYVDEAQSGSELFAASADAAFFGPIGVLSTTHAFVENYASETDPFTADGLIRLETTFVRDDPSRIRSLRVGDSQLYTGLLRPNVRFGGVQIATNFATRPNFVTFPLPALSGETPMPSDLSLYVNDQLTFNDSLGSGPFELEQIPVVTGAGQVRAVTRDVLGREQVVVSDFYASQRVLRAGLSEYAYSAGALREDYGYESNEYGDGFVSALHRYGLNDILTVEGSAEASSDLQRIGGGVSWSLPRLGVSTVGFSYSDEQQAGSGGSWYAGHEYQSALFRYNMSYSGSSDAYRQLGMEEDNGFAKRQFSIGGGLNIAPGGSFGLAIVSQTFHDRDDRNFASVSYNKSFRSGLSISAFTSYLDTGDEGSDVSGGLTFTRPLGPRRSVSMSMTREGDETNLMTQTRYDLPVGPGYGYRFGAQTGEGDDRWEADLAAQSRTGRYALETVQRSGDLSWQANVSGSAAWIGGKPFLAREIRDSFAVVKVNGFEGVDVMLENQYVGTTDASGRVLIPGLRPYEANRVAIDIEDLPITARVDASEVAVAPFFRAGALVAFPADESRDIRLRLVLPDGEPAPEGAAIRLRDRKESFPVGLDGAVYLIGVDDEASATVMWGDNRCGIDIVVPDTDSPIPHLGEIVCR